MNGLGLGQKKRICAGDFELTIVTICVLGKSIGNEWNYSSRRCKLKRSYINRIRWRRGNERNGAQERLGESNASKATLGQTR